MLHRSEQLDLFPPPPPPAYVPKMRHDVVTRAYGHEYVMQVCEDAFEPFYLNVRGTECLITDGFCTYTTEPAGSLFWSETGFRSFGYRLSDPDEIVSAIEAYIDRPAKDGNGCGGKLVRWWPSYVLMWRQTLSFELRLAKGGRDEMWNQWGPERHKEAWREHDDRQATALARMRAKGIDPNLVEPPFFHKGKWPTF